MKEFLDIIILFVLIIIVFYDIYSYYSIFVLNKYVKNEIFLNGKVLEIKKGYTKRGAYLFLNILLENKNNIDAVIRFHSLFRLIEFWWIMKIPQKGNSVFFYCKKEDTENKNVISIYGFQIDKECSISKKKYDLLGIKEFKTWIVLFFTTLIIYAIMYYTGSQSDLFIYLLSYLLVKMGLLILVL